MRQCPAAIYDTKDMRILPERKLGNRRYKISSTDKPRMYKDKYQFTIIRFGKGTFPSATLKLKKIKLYKL